MTLAAIVLAAGAGTRLRPLTADRPKPLCPVGNVTLLDRTLDRLAGLGITGPDRVAVNAHHHADQVADAVGDRAHLSVEREEALGTAGPIGNLRDWLDGRDVLVCNADAYLDGDVGTLLDGWAATGPRLLTTHEPGRGDFGDRRFAGMSLLPWADARRLEPVPTGLYEVVWRDALAEGRVDFADLDGTFVDCGTPADYLAANLHAAGDASLVDPTADATGTVVDSVVGAAARVDGSITRVVVWPGATVAADEVLVDVVRTRDHTVDAT